MGSRIKISDIAEPVRIMEINAAFEEYGTIVDISIAKDNNSASVEFEEKDSGYQAVESTNAREMFGGVVKVELISGTPAPPSSRNTPANTAAEKEGKSGESKEHLTRIFVGNLDRLIEKQELSDAFKHCGNICYTWVSHNPVGFAFVEFDTHAAAQKAVRTMSGAMTYFTSEGLKVTLKEKRNLDNVPKGKRLFVGGIQHDIQKSEILPIFEQYGEVTEVWIAHDAEPRYAFVEFKTAESAQEAMDGVNGSTVMGGSVNVSFVMKKRTDNDNGGGGNSWGGRGRGGRGRGRGGFGKPPVRTHPYGSNYPPERRPPPTGAPRGRPPSGSFRGPRAPRPAPNAYHYDGQYDYNSGGGYYGEHYDGYYDYGAGGAPPPAEPVYGAIPEYRGRPPPRSRGRGGAYRAQPSYYDEQYY